MDALAVHYATPRPARPRRWSWLAAGLFLAASGGPPALGFGLSFLPHDSICPSCGGWGAALGIAATSSLLLATIWGIVHAIRLPARVFSIVLACAAAAIAAAWLVASVGFYFAIQA